MDKGGEMEMTTGDGKVRRMARPATYADIEALPEQEVGQILDGELITLPRPSGEHALAASRLIQQLGAFDLGPIGGWWILPEPELHLGGDVLVPDLAAWRHERLAHPEGRHFRLVPDWICEILSPSTARLDRVRKMRAYAREGAAHVWLLDPIARTLESFRSEGSTWTRAGAWGGDEQARVEPFAELELRLGVLWPARPPAAD
jgi:Uma2 family endonuclease